MRVGFLFNHDQIHQIAHSLSVAIELAQRGRVESVSILTSGLHLTGEVHRLLQLAGAHLPIEQLGLKSAPSRLAARCLNAVLPASKLAPYRDHLALFATFDTEALGNEQQRIAHVGSPSHARLGRSFARMLFSPGGGLPCAA